jgi:hypothetical protein
VPALDAAVIAAAGLLATYAFVLLLRSLVPALKAATPGFFGFFWDGVSNGATGIYNAIRPAMDAAAAPALGLFNAVEAGLRALLDGPLGFARSSAAALERLANQAIPGVRDLAWTWVNNVENNVAGLARALFAQVEADLGLLRHFVVEEVSGTGSILVNYIGAVYAQLLAFVEQAFARAEAGAQAGLGALESEARQALATEVARAGEAERTLGQFVQQEVQSAVDYTSATAAALDAEIARAAAALGQDVRDAQKILEAEQQALESRVNEQIDAVLKSGPWGALVAAYEGGEAAYRADVAALATLALEALRQQLRDPGAIRESGAAAIAEQLAKIARG